jgi:hypothetical protein
MHGVYVNKKDTFSAKKVTFSAHSCHFGYAHEQLFSSGVKRYVPILSYCSRNIGEKQAFHKGDFSPTFSLFKEWH